MKKRLYRSTDQKVIAGVMGGVGEYLDTDPVFIRLVYLFATIFTGVLPGIIAYFVAILLVPVAPIKVTATSVDDTSEV